MTHDDMLFRLRRALMKAAKEEGVTKACERFGLSRTTYYRWRARYLAYGEDALRPRDRRPPAMPNRLGDQIEKAILAYTLIWPTHGPARIAYELSREKWGAYRVSASGVYNVLRRLGLGTRYERLLRLEEIYAPVTGLLSEEALRAFKPRGERGPIQAQAPGDLLCLDTFYVGKLKGVGRLWQFTCVDAACSFAFARLAPANTAREAARFLTEEVLPAYEEAGHEARAILTDNGSEYKADFARAVLTAGIEQRRTRPRSPQTNGFVERFHGTVLHEFYRIAFRRSFYENAFTLQVDLDDFLHYYNFDRAHQGYRLKGRTPSEVFFASHDSELSPGRESAA